MPISEIGCCGAYCGTCKVLSEGHCRGCKLGYDGSKRDINKAKCQMKLCCFRDRGFQTCADCSDYHACDIISSFYDKNGYKYKKYKQAIDYIREHGYDAFLTIADGWRGAYGKYPR